MSILLLVGYYEVLPVIALIKSNILLWKKILAMIIYNIILIKALTPPSVYRLEEIGLNIHSINILYFICETIKYLAPFILFFWLNRKIKFN